MNCETADNLILDELYGELDEASRPLLAAHLETCSSCRASKARLVRGKEAAAALPPVEAPDSLEARILAMLPADGESDADTSAVGANEHGDVAVDGDGDGATSAKVVPITAAVVSMRAASRSRRFFSAAGNWAMRPQTAMAAVFLLMVGTSTLALRMKHKNSEAAMSVSEQGAPIASASTNALADEEDRPEPSGGGNAHGVALARRGAVAAAPAVAAADVPSDPSLSNAGPSAGKAALGGAANMDDAKDRDGRGEEDKKKQGTGEGEFGNAMSAYNARNFSEAVRRFDALAAKGDKQAALWAARSVRAANGCSTALTRFDHLASTAFGTPAGYDATMESGTCYRDLGYLEAASSRFQRLVNVPSHADAARAALESVRQIAAKRSDEMKGHGDPAQASGAGAGGMARPAASAAPAAKAADRKGTLDAIDPFSGPPRAPAKPAAPAPAPVVVPDKNSSKSN